MVQVYAEPTAATTSQSAQEGRKTGRHTQRSMGSSSTDLLLEFGLAVVAVVLFLLVRARLIRAQRARLIEYTLPLLAK